MCGGEWMWTHTGKVSRGEQPEVIWGRAAMRGMSGGRHKAHVERRTRPLSSVGCPESAPGVGLTGRQRSRILLGEKIGSCVSVTRHRFFRKPISEMRVARMLAKRSFLWLPLSRPIARVGLWIGADGADVGIAYAFTLHVQDWTLDMGPHRGALCARLSRVSPPTSARYVCPSNSTVCCPR